MGQKPLDSHPIDRALAQILDEALSTSDYSLRALSRASGVRLTRLGDVLRRGKSMTTGEVEQISHALGLVAWEVVQEAERRIDTPTTAGAGHSSAASAPGAVVPIGTGRAVVDLPADVLERAAAQHVRGDVEDEADAFSDLP